VVGSSHSASWRAWPLLVAAVLAFAALASWVLVGPKGAVASTPAFEPNVRVDDSGASATNPRMAVDDNGDLHVIWLDMRSGNNDIYYSRSTNGGTTWSPSVRVDNGPGITAAAGADIAVSNSGAQVYVTYHDTRNGVGNDDVWLARSVDGGATWLASVRVDDQLVGTVVSRNAVVAVDDAGTVFAAFEDRRNATSPFQIYFAKSTNGGVSFTPNTQVSDVPVGGFTWAPLALDTYGTDQVYVAFSWSDSASVNSIASANSTNGGGSWTRGTAASGAAGEPLRSPDLATRSGGRVSLTYTHATPTGESVRYSEYSGATWSPSSKVDDAGAGVNREAPSVSVFLGDPHVVWADDRMGSFDIFASGSQDGVTWGDGNPTNNNDPAVNDIWVPGQAQPHSAATLFGLYAVWQDYRNGATPDIYFARYVFSDVLITEFRNGPDGQEAVELVNYGGLPADFTGWTLTVDSIPYSLSPLGTVPGGTVGGEYRTVGDSAGDDLVDPAFTLAEEGGVIELRDAANFLVDRVAWGQQGVAPDPLPTMSSCLHFDGSSYVDEWSFDMTPTFGSLNDCGRVVADPPLILNEVYRHAPGGQEATRFIELFYRGNATLNTTGYRLLGNTLYTIPGNRAIDLTPANAFSAVENADSSLLFQQTLPAGDNYYLFDPAFNLLDEVGWSTTVNTGSSLCRNPDGFGDWDGYDTPTSTASGWVLGSGCLPSPPLVGIGPDQMKWGDLGTVVSFNLTVTNKQSDPDYLDLTTTSAPNGWSVSLSYDPNGMVPVVDNDNDSLPDTGLLAREESIMITAHVSIALAVPASTTEFVNVTATASLTSASKTARLRVNLYPFLQLDRWADPTTINVLGTGFGERTTITLAMEGRGVVIPGVAYNAADVVYVFDDTASMAPWIAQAQADADTVTDALIANISSVRFGLVSYKDSPEIDVDIDLTSDVNAFKAALFGLVAAGGGPVPEDVHLGIETAANLSWRPGNVARVMIVIGDAEDNDNAALVNVAQWVNTSRGMHINALLAGSDLNADLWFRAMAAAGNGFFFPLGSPGQMANAIINGTLEWVPPKDVSASDDDLTDANPMVRDVLPPYIDYVPGTFVDPATMAPRNPAWVGTDGASNTLLDWNVSMVKVNQTWSVQFQVTSTQPGLVPTNVYGRSRASFLDWDNRSRTLLFPEVLVTVLAPAIIAPRIETTWDGSSQVGLVWQPPVVLPQRYLIYRVSGDPRGFIDLSPAAAYATEFPPTTAWNDPEPFTGVGERYYLIRSANANTTLVSATSNIAGVFGGPLNAGVTAVSRPLGYFPWVDYSGAERDTVEEHRVAFGASVVEYMDPAGSWQAVPGPGDPNAVVGLGEAYLVRRATPGRFVFTGLPAAQLLFDERPFPGYAPATDARSLVAAVDGNDVDLTFAQAPGITPGVDSYEVWWAATRTGFFDGTASLVGGGPLVAPPGAAVAVTHLNALTLSNELYYQVVPVSASLGSGASTYSVGVWTRMFLGSTTFALPLRPEVARGVSWYADAIPFTQGIVWLTSSGVWVPHFTAMPAGTYDTAAVLGSGYQIGVRSASPVRFSFVGW